MMNTTPNFTLHVGFQKKLFARTLHGTAYRTSCHHKSDGACGACYARLSTLLDAIKAEPTRAAEFVAALEAEMQAECRPDQRAAIGKTAGDPLCDWDDACDEGCAKVASGERTAPCAYTCGLAEQKAGAR